MHLPRFCYGDVSCHNMSGHVTPKIILSLTRDDCPSILTMWMDMSGYFLPRMGMPYNNR